MAFDLYQVDAFTSKLFGGNSAAVCVLKERRWLKDRVMAAVAKENNLAETAFCYKVEKNVYKLRWFTPEIEMDLCGHATLATAHVVFTEYEDDSVEVVKFESEFIDGGLEVRKTRKGSYQMSLPNRPPKPESEFDSDEKRLLKVVLRGIGKPEPKEILKNRDYVLVYESEADVAKLKPDETTLNEINLDPGGIICTAKATSNSQFDFVSRFFTPQCTVFEDPVTGSAHCTSAPFWAQRLGKNRLKAAQISDRRGEIFCQVEADRVLVEGEALTFFKGRADFGPDPFCSCSNLPIRGPQDTNVRLCKV